MSSKDGVEKVFSFDETISKYKDVKAYDLEKLTHKKNFPWKIAEGYIKNNPIKLTDQIIKDYHLNEQKLLYGIKNLLIQVLFILN